MKEPGTSRQRQYTRNAFRDAYLELLQELPADKISIVELCERAEINRTTFYRHYKSIADLREKLIEDLFRQIFEVLASYPESQLLVVQKPDHRLAQKQILKALNATIKNRRLCAQLLCAEHTNLAAKALEGNLLLLLKTIRSTGCTEAEANLCYAYVCGGLANLWTHWIASDFSVPKERMALIVEEFLLGFYDVVGNGCLVQVMP